MENDTEKVWSHLVQGLLICMGPDSENQRHAASILRLMIQVDPVRTQPLIDKIQQLDREDSMLGIGDDADTNYDDGLGS